jgi:PAS domain S-box-containing protein
VVTRIELINHTGGIAKMKPILECQINLESLTRFEKERILEILLNDSPDVVVCLATDLTLRMVNRSFTQQTGIAADEVIGNSGFNFFPDFNKRLAYLLQKSRLSKRPVVSKANLQLPSGANGTAIWQATIYPLYEAANFNGWMLIFKKTGSSSSTALLRTALQVTTYESPAQIGLSKILRAVSGWLPFGIVECDLDGRLLDVSEAFLTSTGLTWDEGQGYGWMELIPIEERDKLRGQWQEYCRQESGWSLQYEIRCRNGGRRVLSSRAQPVRDPHGKLTSWLVLNFDVTREQREREEKWQAVQASQEFFNSVINHTAIGLAFYSGDDLKLRWANPEFRELIEESQFAQAVAGIQLQHDLPYVENFKLDQLVTAVRTHKIPQTDLAVDYKNPKQPGRAHWRVGIVPVWASAGPVPDLLITALNISTVADAAVSGPEEERESGPGKLKTIDWEAVIDQLTEGLLVLDLSGRVMALNQKAVQLLGVSPDANYAEGSADNFGPLYQLYTPDGKKIAPEGWPHFRLLRGETFVNFETDLRQPEQDQFKRLSFSGVRLPNRENQSDLVMLTCSDRDEVRQLQEANLKLQAREGQHQDLIRRLTEATPQLDTGVIKLYDAVNMYDILKGTLESVRQTIRADNGAIYLFNDQGDIREVYQLWQDEATTFLLNLNEQPQIRLAVETKKPVYFTVAEAIGRETAWFNNTGINGCLAVPLLEKADHCIGILFLHFAAATISFNDADRDYIQAVVAKYAVVISRAKTQLERSRMLISERRARVRAESKAAKLSALLQSLQEGVNVIDTSGNILLRNKMEQQITRVPDQTAVSIMDYGNFRLLWPDNKPVPVQQLPGNRLLRGETIDDTEFVIEHSDGLRLNVICNGSVIRGEDGQIVLGILITRDITQMRQLEESREAFIRTVSHDLRNPLTVVSARSQLLQRRLVKQNLRVEAEEAQVIYVSARRMTQMIQEMFDSYRLESKNLKLNKRMTDLAALIKDLISRIGLEEDLKRLQLEITAGDYRIYADEERLERAVTNLIVNALKYSSHDRPIVVRLFSQANRIVIEVTDFGMGIDAQDLPKVFDRYYRAKSVKDSGGLGLGLYIVKLIVEAHEGKIDVVSQVDEGSTFSITLPVVTETEEGGRRKAEGRSGC